MSFAMSIQQVGFLLKLQAPFARAPTVDVLKTKCALSHRNYEYGYTGSNSMSKTTSMNSSVKVEEKI
jgi:hypothetical protein